jgi:predicted nucleotidyltransferase
MSLLDKPQIHLVPQMFNPDETMRQDFREYVLTSIDRMVPKGTVVGVYLLGSSAGRQYNEKSDIDINLILADGLELDNFKEYIKSFNERPYPGTERPINYHAQEYSEPTYRETSEYAVYNILDDCWEVRPKAYGDIQDPEKKFKTELDYARMYARLLKEYDHEALERDRKAVYSLGWGTPRDLQQNILYKFIERLKTKK